MQPNPTCGGGVALNLVIPFGEGAPHLQVQVLGEQLGAHFVELSGNIYAS
jgi:hypothetical protein